VIFYRYCRVPAFKLQAIDGSILSEHSCLTSEDHCYFFGDYLGRQGFKVSDMNDLMQNFKKPIDRKTRPEEWKWKTRAIQVFADMILTTSIWEKAKNCTWVPMPSSKLKSDPLYDDRLMQVLQRLKEKKPSLDVRELLSIKAGREQAHSPGGARPTVDEHLTNLTFDGKQKAPAAKTIIIFDDVITTGASFKSAKTILQAEYPDASIVGIFIARSIRQDTIT
jgi:hypothetical protein